MQRTLAFLLFVLLSCPLPLVNGYAQTEERLELPLQQALDQALQSNLGLKVERFNPKITLFEIQKNWGAFDPLFSLSLNHEDSQTPLTRQFSIAAGGLNAIETKKTSLASRLEGKLSPGTQYQLLFDSARDSNTFNQFDPEYSQTVSTTLTQPLLKDRGSETNLAFVQISKNQTAVSEWELKQKMIDTLTDVEKIYWDLVFSIENMKVKQESLRLSQDLLKENQLKAKVGTLPPLEVIQSEAGVAVREEALLDAEQMIIENENALKRLIFADPAKERHIRIIPTDHPNPTPQNIPTPRRIQWSLENSPRLQQIKLELLNRNIFLKYYKNQLLPRLDLEGTLGLNGLGNEFSNSLDDLTNTSHPFWGTGIVFKYPLGHRQDSALYQQSKLQAQKSILELKNFENEMAIQIDTLATQLGISWKKLQATLTTERFAAEALKAEQKKYEAGVSTSHQVLEFEKELMIAKTNKLKAKIDYLKTIVALEQLQGTTLQSKSFLMLNKELIDLGDSQSSRKAWSLSQRTKAKEENPGPISKK